MQPKVGGTLLPAKVPRVVLSAMEVPSNHAINISTVLYR